MTVLFGTIRCGYCLAIMCVDGSSEHVLGLLASSRFPETLSIECSSVYNFCKYEPPPLFPLGENCEVTRNLIMKMNSSHAIAMATDEFWQ